MQSLILSAPLCPGDIATLTAAIETLHRTYPGCYRTDTRTPCPAIFEHNPHIKPIADDDPTARRLDLNYSSADNPNSINRSDDRSISFLGGYCAHLGELIRRPLPLAVNRPFLYLSEEETQWTNQVAEVTGRAVPFWIVNAGVKSDYTAKQWPVEHYQTVIDRTRGRIQWVQIGELSAGHNHPPLAGVIDLRGKTDLRQLIRLVWHSSGGLGPVTLLQHLCAAWQKPYVCLLGGREPATWVSYPLQTTLHTLGSADLPCCRFRACWKSRIVPFGDPADDKNRSLCEYPVFGLARPVAKCMATIQPERVIAALDSLGA